MIWINFWFDIIVKTSDKTCTILLSVALIVRLAVVLLINTASAKCLSKADLCWLTKPMPTSMSFGHKWSIAGIWKQFSNYHQFEKWHKIIFNDKNCDILDLWLKSSNDSGQSCPEYGWGCVCQFSQIAAKFQLTRN